MKKSIFFYIALLGLIVASGCSGGPSVTPVATCAQCPNGIAVTITVLMPDCTPIKGGSGFQASIAFHGLTGPNHDQDTVYAHKTTDSQGKITETVPCGDPMDVEVNFRLPDPSCPAGTEIYYTAKYFVPSISASASCTDAVQVCAHKTGDCVS